MLLFWSNFPLGIIRWILIFHAYIYQQFDDLWLCRASSAQQNLMENTNTCHFRVQFHRKNIQENDIASYANDTVGLTEYFSNAQYNEASVKNHLWNACSIESTLTFTVKLCVATGKMIENSRKTKCKSISSISFAI